MVFFKKRVIRFSPINFTENLPTNDTWRRVALLPLEELPLMRSNQTDDITMERIEIRL